MAVADPVQFSHRFGNTHMSFWVDLENIGGKAITIKHSNCLLERRGHVQRLTAKTFWLTESFSRERAVEIPFSEIALKPGERWSGFLHLWDTLSWGKEIESSVKSITTKIRDDINLKIMALGQKLEGERKPVEAEPQLVQDALNVVKNLRKLEQGEYCLLVVSYEDPNQQPLKILGFDLTLFESDIRDIFEDTEDYKYGFGVYLPATKNKYVQVQIRSKNGEDSKKLFNKLSHSTPNV